MRVVKAEEIVPVIERLCIEANCYLGEDIKNGYREGLEKEESETGNI